MTEEPAASSRSGCLIASTRGIRARHRHLLRDLTRLLPHSKPHSKVDTDEAGLDGMPALCEDNGCSTSLLLDARDPRRLYMWVAGCPDGPTSMFRVLNIHTVAELKLEARRVFGARNIVVFDEGFNRTADRRVMRAILARTFSVPRPGFADPRLTIAPSAAGGLQAARHLISFSWLDGSIWLRVYRIQGHIDGSGALDVEEIGPRLVLSPIRIIASGFAGAILHSS